MQAEKPNAAFDQVQSLCRQFRKQLKQGGAASLSEYLERVDESSQEMLFQNLLHLEVEFRRRKGEQPTSGQYLKRFPKFASVIRQAFFESTMMSQEAQQDTPTSAETVTFSLPAARRIGDYELLRELGRGGFGVVYEAKHLHRGDRVALKTLPMLGEGDSTRDAERLHRFRREFRSLSEINHPHLAGMQTLEVDGNQWFFTMDLIEGVVFLEYVRPQDRLDETRLRKSVKQLALGVLSLHDLGIVHRDLKPSNVLVDSDGHVTILDFGLVAELQHFGGETLSIGAQHFAGTPRYAAPEQSSGQRSAAVDWYALGVMLYEAITGDVPFKGSGVELLVAKQTTDPPLLSDRDGVPQDLAELVDAFLRRDPTQRPSDQQVSDAFGVRPDSNRHESSSADSSLGKDSVTGDAPLLIGREGQLAQLGERLNQFTTSGEPQTIFISGRSGEGKTTLADAFLELARRDAKTLVLAGRCYDRESVPFKAIDCLIDPLVAFLRLHRTEDLNKILPNDIGMLARLFPVLRRVEAISALSASIPTNLDSRQIRYHAFSAFRELLTNIGRSRPVILFVDDLQWGDADSAAALHEMLRPPDCPTVLLLGSYRSDEAANSQFLTEWHEKQLQESTSIEQNEVKVAPLTEQQCVLLMASRLGISPEILRLQSGQLFEDTLGNPYFVEQLIEGFDAQSNAFRAVPLDELIKRKLERLPPDAKPILEALSIAGQAASVEEITAILNQPGSAFATLTHMRSERLIRIVGSPGRQLVDTYHDKIRETILKNLGDARQRELHIRFGELIERLENIDSYVAMDGLDRDDWDEYEQPTASDRIFDLAYHFFAARDPRGFVYQFLAGEQSFRAYASEDALAYLDRALSSLPDDASDRMRFRVWERRASSLARLTLFDEALESYRQALRYAKSTEAIALTQFGIARSYQSLGRFHEATQSFDAVLNTFGVPRPAVLGALVRIPYHAAKVILVPYRWQRSSNKSQVSLAGWEQRVYSAMCLHLCEVYHPIDFAHAVFRQAWSAVRTGQPAKISQGLTESGAYIAWAGLLGLSQRMLSRATDAAGPAMTDEEKSKHLFYSGFSLASSGRHRQATSQYIESLPILIKKGLYFEAYYCAHFMRHLYALTASSTSELEVAREVLRLADETGNVQGQCWGSYDIALAMARAGNLPSAHQWIERARERIGDRWMNSTGVIFLAAQGFVSIQSSDYKTAALRLEEGWQTGKRQKLIMEYLFQVLPWLLEASAGPRWDSRASVTTAKRLKLLCREAWMIAWVFPNLKSQILRSRGRANAALGKQRKAARLFEKSIRIATELGTDFDRAKGLLDLAAVQEANRHEMRAEAITLLKKLDSVIPHAESWLLGDQFDPDVIAPMRWESDIEKKESK